MEQYNVTGMSCAACSARVEKAVKKVPGVTSCSVSLLTNSMGVEGTASPAAILSAVQEAGYGASPKSASASKAADTSADLDALADRETPKLKRRLIASLGFLLVLMYFSMGHMMWGWPLPHWFDGNHVAMGLVQLLLAGIVMVINQKFFINGFKGLIHGAPNMDTLVALGSMASFVWSTYALFAMTRAQVDGNDELVMHYMMEFYFESAAMILTLITVGKMLEARSKGKTTDARKSRMKLAPKTATLVRDGAEVTVAIADVQKGDVFVVRPGEVAVEVVGAGEVVRREDALDGEVGTVRAAAHGGGLGFDAGRGEGVIEVVDAHAVVVAHGVGDVGVGVGELDLDTGFRMTEAEVFGGAHELFLLAFVEGLVVVADLHREDGLARVGLHRLEDHESLAVFGAFRRFGAVEHVDEVVHDEDRVDEDTLGGHRVGRDALDRQLGVAGIERFPDHFAEFAAVDRVGEVDGELGEVHLAGALFAELFVGNEDDVDVAVRTVLARDDGEGRHDVGDGGLVVGAKHGRAVGDNDVVAHVAFDFRMFGRLEPDVLFLVEADYALKYVDTNYTLDVVNDLGVSKDALANQYKYTQDIVTDSKGALKGASWQACPIP